MTSPILVTGAAGAVGGVGRTVTELLLARGDSVRALVRREDERADALRRLGAPAVQSDLTDLASMHRAIEGCGRIYFGMSVSPAYLEATINTAVVARHHGVEAFANMSQMTVSHRKMGFSEHLVRHLSAMAELTKQGRYDRMTDTVRRLTGEAPTNMRDFVKLHAPELEQRVLAHAMPGD